MTTWNIENLTGYKPKTTFWEDFTIADAFGLHAIKDTYLNAFNSWRDNVEYLTELVMVLNHKLWEHYHRGNDKYARMYDNLWRMADDYAVSNLKGDDLRYFLEVTD